MGTIRINGTRKERKDHALWMNQKNMPAATLLRMRDRREEMKMTTPTGTQQCKYLGLLIVLSSKTREFVEG